MVSATSSPPRRRELADFARALRGDGAQAWVYAMRTPAFSDVAWRRGREDALALERRVCANLETFVATTLRAGDVLLHDGETDLFAIALGPTRHAIGRAPGDRRAMFASIETGAREAAGVETYGSWSYVGPGDDVRELLGDAALRGRATLQRRAFATLLHDLATPIASIHASLAAVTDGVLTPETERRFLQASQAEAARMGRMVRGFLCDRRDDEASSDAFVLLGRALGAVEPLARERGVALKMCSRSGSTTIAMDGDRALSVFIALVENAVKHGRPGGRVKTRALDAGGACRIEVDDDGPGVDDDAARGIFEFGVRFGDGDGYGIGLAAARSLVTASGGRICVERSPLGGARFAVTLPQAPPRAHE